MSLQIAHTPEALREIIQSWRAENLSVGFVPTMGALHEGHISLVRLALEKSDRVVVSVFVNPTQFAPHEDFDSYPRMEEEDLQKLETAGAHLAYLPTEKDIYPDGQESTIKPGAAAEGLESDFRPHFFDGVCNVVHRLFKQVQPDIAVFGEKDFQQLQVIRESVEAAQIPITIIGGPIIRDADGLALSSRNAYLSETELSIARQLNKILARTAKTHDTAAAEKELLAAEFDKVDYVAERWDRVLAAAYIGKTRLIDNMEIKKQSMGTQ